MGFFGGNQMPVDGKTILLTGGSEGMGYSVAKQLAAKGANIIIVSRNVERLQSAIADVKTAARNPEKQRFHYISADATDPSYATTVLAEANAWNNHRSPDIVWCVAGSADIKLFIETDPATLRRQMDLNYFGQAEMAHAILREWLAPDFPVEKEARHFVMTASVISFFTIPGYSAYGPAKCAIRSLADTISHELLLYPQNVKVHVVFPGTILSPGYDRENITKPQITKDLEAADPKQTPDEVAARSIKGLESGAFFCSVSWLSELLRLCGLGGSIRNNLFVDTLGMIFMALAWPFILSDGMRQIKKYGKKHGHPATYAKDHA